jgi:hypothetical protein
MLTVRRMCLDRTVARHITLQHKHNCIMEHVVLAIVNRTVEFSAWWDLGDLE